MVATLTIGIAGGAASGKTTLVEKLASPSTTLLPCDMYYHDLAHLSREERGRYNFDHPDAIDWDRLADDIRSLQRGISIHRPDYCFVEHLRRPHGVLVEPRPIIIVEGFLLLSTPAVRELLDLKVFINCSATTRARRKLLRDVHERGRAPEASKAQWENLTLPMHERFVAPTAAFADLVLNGELPVEKLTGAVREWVSTQKLHDGSYELAHTLIL